MRRALLPASSLQAALCLAAVLVANTAAAEAARIKLDVRGFSEDKKTMLVRIDDVNNGLSLRAYEMEPGQMAKPAKKSTLEQFNKVDEIKKTKELRKKFKVKDAGTKAVKFQMQPDDPDAVLSFFGVIRGAEGERLVIACTDGARLGRVMSVPVKLDEESKQRYDASLKTIYWTADKKVLVAVVTQAIETDGFSDEHDELHVLAFRPAEVQWMEPEPKPAEAPAKDGEKKEEKKKNWWWPFGD